MGRPKGFKHSEKAKRNIGKAMSKVNKGVKKSESHKKNIGKGVSKSWLPGGKCRLAYEKRKLQKDRAERLEHCQRQAQESRAWSLKRAFNKRKKEEE